MLTSEVLKYVIFLHVLGSLMIYNVNLIFSWAAWRHFLTFSSFNILSAMTAAMAGHALTIRGLNREAFLLSILVPLIITILIRVFLQAFYSTDEDNEYVLDNKYRKTYIIQVLVVVFMTTSMASITSYLMGFVTNA